MATKKKPVIANVARPEGFIDDVVLPIAQRVVRGSKTSGRIAAARAKSYEKRGNKAYDRMEDAITRKNARTKDAASTMRKIDAEAGKYVLNQRKQEAVRRGASVRKAARDYRAKYPKKK